MAADQRWRRAWLLTILAVQFILALIVMAINGDYWHKYGGVVYSEEIDSGFTEIGNYTYNVEQVTTPLNMYIFGISGATMGMDVLETLSYFAGGLHPVFAVLLNIALLLAWGGCLVVYFLWGGGLEYTGAQWVSQYHSFCILQEPPVTQSVDYYYTITCGGEKILLIMLPFICLSIIICPLLALFCFITSVEGYSRKQDARYHERYQRAPLADVEKPPPAAPAPQYSPPQTEPVPQLDSQVVSPISPAGGAPQPFVYQGVLYQPVGIDQPQQSYPGPPNELGGEQLKKEMAGDQPKGEMPGDGVRAELHADKT